MNITFNLFVKIIFLLFLAKVVTFPLLFLLPHFGVDIEKDFSVDIYHHYTLQRAFNLKKSVQVKEIKKPTYQLKNLKLKAIYAQGENGVVAFEDKGKLFFLSTGESYKGYKLIRVELDRAIFERGGKRYELRLEEKTLQSRFTYEPKDVSYAVLKKDVDYYKKHFNAIWKDISIQELYDKKTKKLTGFKVTRVNQNSIFGKIGLQKGDIIIGVNNRRFHSVADAFKVYRNIDKYNSIKITILRNNEERDLEYEIY